MTENMEPLTVSPTEAARLLGVSRAKLYNLINTPNFPAFKCGGRTLISVAGLRAWVDGQAGGNHHGGQ